MKRSTLFIAMSVLMSSSMAENSQALQHKIDKLQQQALTLQHEIDLIRQKHLQSYTQQHLPNTSTKVDGHEVRYIKTTTDKQLTIHQLSEHPDSLEFYPTALLADEHVVSYIAGMPVVSSPYLGDRPAFDGSDYIVNISSINRDIRLMQQRRRLYNAYRTMGYPEPDMPIMALSGKVEAIGWGAKPYVGNRIGDIDLGSSELDVAAIANRNIEAFMSFAYGPQTFLNNQRAANSALYLNQGFINIGDLDKTPLYFTIGQLYVPFGRYASAMVSPTLPMLLTRTKARPFIIGYKSRQNSGPYLAGYGFKSDANIGKSAAGGINAGYIFDDNDWSGDLGVGYISTIADSAGMQSTSGATNTFAGFSSFTHGSESVGHVPGTDVHATLSVGRFNFTAEYVQATEAFRMEDLSFNAVAAKPSAGQAEVGYTFKLGNLPASLGASYQWTKHALALNIPKRSLSGVFSISLWKDTVESLEYRHDIDYADTDFANGAAPVNVVNTNTLGTGRKADTVTAQIGVYF